MAIFGFVFSEMKLPDRIKAFDSLGSLLREPDLMAPAISAAARANAWFTPRETKRALADWSRLLTRENLERWTSLYPVIPERVPADILVITAGNIPLAGFHDYLSVLITGNRFYGQLSSRDNILLPAITGLLAGIEPEFANLVSFTPESTSNPDAVIATGSNNTSRYFRHHYGKLPHIFRHNRNSAAIIDGNESTGELEGLASDMLEYYGLGCRSISRVLAPAGHRIDQLVRAISGFSDLDQNMGYENNLNYQRARLTLHNQKFTDAGNLLLVDGDILHSPISTVYISLYDHEDDIRQFLNLNANQIQCIAGHAPHGYPSVSFGTAQQPELWDYADGIDTIEFLINLTDR